jgi:hypothetical protein
VTICPTRQYRNKNNILNNKNNIFNNIIKAAPRRKQDALKAAESMTSLFIR